ncbi:hypothetical protein D3C75_1356710 [compost metagenome]
MLAPTGTSVPVASANMRMLGLRRRHRTIDLQMLEDRALHLLGMAMLTQLQQLRL